VSDYNGSSSMRRIARLQSCTLVTALLFLGVSIRSASASAAFYLGTWKITSAVVAPWSDPARKPDAAEMKTLVGTAVVFTADAIRGPRALACAHCGIKSGTIQPTCSFTVLSAKCTSVIRRLTRLRLPQA